MFTSVSSSASMAPRWVASQSRICCSVAACLSCLANLDVIVRASCQTRRRGERRSSLRMPRLRGGMTSRGYSLRRLAEILRARRDLGPAPRGTRSPRACRRGTPGRCSSASSGRSRRDRRNARCRRSARSRHLSAALAIAMRILPSGHRKIASRRTGGERDVDAARQARAMRVALNAQPPHRLFTGFFTNFAARNEPYAIRESEDSIRGAWQEKRIETHRRRGGKSTAPSIREKPAGRSTA